MRLEELGIGFRPLDARFLTGEIDVNIKFTDLDFRNTEPRFAPRARRTTWCWLICSAVWLNAKALLR